MTGERPTVHGLPTAVTRERAGAIGPGQGFAVTIMEACLRVQDAITIRWVRTHRGVEGNEVADEYAMAAATGEAVCNETG